MNRVKLANGTELSQMVYGVWRLADTPDCSVHANLERIEACLNQGITTFDHADIYGDYRCESLFGDVIKARPSLKNQIQVVTKTDIMLISKQWPSTRVKHYDTTAKHVEASLERSLKRLGLEIIDLLLIHRPDPLCNATELGACLDRLIDSGKIKGAGVSNYMPWDVDLLQSRMKHKLQTNQIEFSLLHVSPLINGQISYAQQHHMPIMAWSPLGGGKLFSEVQNTHSVASRLHQKLSELAQHFETDIGAVAISWLMHHPVHVLPIMGSNQIHRIQQFKDAYRVKMDRQTWFELYELALGHEVL